MLQEKVDSIIIGKRVRKGIVKLDKNYSPPAVFGFDCEASGAYPYSLQISGEEGAEFIWIYGMNEEKLLQLFFSRAKRGMNCFFAFNLSYDLGNLFKIICRNRSKSWKGYKMKVIYPEPTFMKVTSKDEHKTIQFMDAMYFFRGSLAKAAETFGIKYQKMEHPACVKEGRFPRKDEMEYLKKYAIIDAQIAEELGKHIVDYHRAYNVPVTWTVTPATLAAKIYRKSFLKQVIPYQPPFINKLAMLSYNGGRTESFCYGTTDVKIYDINSSYPFAMTQIPVPTDKHAWVRVNSVREETPGFYVISGEIPEQKISPLPVKQQRFVFPVGSFKNIVVSGYEALLIEQYGKIKKCYGFVYKGESDDSFRNYIADFYAKKNAFKEKKDAINYQFSKLMLNSTYGKTIQANPLDDEAKQTKFAYFDQSKKELIMLPNNKKYIAAGMWNPVIASWITSFARARIFNFMKEHEDDIVYTDTDSLIIRGNASIPHSNDLGSLNYEGRGRGTIVREKMYLIKERENILKGAKHAFQASINELDRVLNDKSTGGKYVIKRMVRLREAYRQHKVPFVFETQSRVIDLSPSMKRQRPVDFKNFDILHDFQELKPLVFPKLVP